MDGDGDHGRNHGEAPDVHVEGPELRHRGLPLYETEGGYVVQGIKLDDDTRAQLRQLGGDEDGVFVPAAVLDRLRGT
jgi:hypothetical protein